MQEEDKREIAEYIGRELKEREDYLLSTEVKRGYDSPIEDELNLRGCIDVLLRRKWVVVSCLFISVITVAIASSLMKPIYRSEAIIEIAPENPKITTFQEVVELEPQSQQTDTFYETQYKLIKSQSLAIEVISTLKLDSNSEFAVNENKLGFISFVKDAVAQILSTKEEESDPKAIERKKLASEEGLINSFLGGVEVIPDRKTRLVRVGFVSPNPELSVKVTNTLVKKYIEWTVQRKLDATQAARGFLEKQLGEVKAALERAEEALGTYAKGADIVSLDDKRNLTYKEFEELNDALSKAETERLSKEALYKEVQAKNYAYLPQVISNPSIQKLNEEYTNLKSQYDNMAAIYEPNYPDMEKLAAQLAAFQSETKRLINGIAESIKEDYEAALKKENILRQRQEEQKKLVSQLNDKTVQFKILEREVETNKSIYQSLLQRLKETEVTSGIKATNIQVVDYALPPLSPYKPNIKLNVLLATLMGLMGGVFLAFIFEHFDNTLKDEEQIKKHSSLPFLGAIPVANVNDLQGLEKIVHVNPRSQISEAFRVIRTSILYSFPERSPKSLLITSAQPLEGKTTSASNLALSIIQSGLRVVLIDADLRRPRLHKLLLDNGNGFGLSTYLVGKMDLSDVLKRANVSSLDIIPSGPIPPNPAELVGSNRMKELIERLLKEYDHVILDGPPIMDFADSRLLSRLVDGVLLVTSIGITRRQELRSGVEEILRLRGRIIGAIVNRLDSRRSKYGYNYYYGHEASEREKGPTLPPGS